jgi:hypothetical protein
MPDPPPARHTRRRHRSPSRSSLPVAFSAGRSSDARARPCSTVQGGPPQPLVNGRPPGHTQEVVVLHVPEDLRPALVGLARQGRDRKVAIEMLRAPPAILRARRWAGTASIATTLSLSGNGG